MKLISYKSTKLYCPSRYFSKNLTDRFRENRYEKEEEEMIKYFNKKDIVLEIGSCLGYTASILSKVVSKVISIEGNPELKESLNRMKRENNMENVVFLNSFISKTKKNVNFQTYDNIVAGSGDREDMSINNVRGWGNSLKEYVVKTLKIEDINDYKKINSLFLDMEGGELIFFEEYKEYIRDNINKVCVELHGHQMLMDDRKFNNKCIQILKECGLKHKESKGCTHYFER